MTIGGVILAGGLSRRMGGQEKALLPLGDQPMIAHVHARLAPWVNRLAINANGDAARFDLPETDILPDLVADNPGPLAGILTGMIWAAARNDDWLLTAPVDCPFLPADLVPNLLRAASDDVEIVIARSGGRHHPVIALWRPSLAATLEKCLMIEGVRKIDHFTDRHHTLFVDWATDKGDPFDNINTLADLDHARLRLGV